MWLARVTAKLKPFTVRQMILLRGFWRIVMDNNNAITEKEAYASIGKRLVGELHNAMPSGVGVYSYEQDFGTVWHAYVDNNNLIGASRVLVISKITGKIIGDQMVGE